MNWDRFPNFSASEFECQGKNCCGHSEEMDSNFISMLQQLRDQMGWPIIIFSVYRCPKHNNDVSSTGRAGPHTTGRAVDIAVVGSNTLSLLATAIAVVGMTGIGVKQHGVHSRRFIHLDILKDHETKGPRPWLWSY